MNQGTTTGVVQVPAAAAHSNKWLVAASLCLGAVMGAIDTSIVNVALPQIRGAVGATVQEITWISTGYAIALVMVMPLTGFFGRLFGQKRLYLVSLVLFIIGSALCGIATSLSALVAYRLLQGFGAGAIQPTIQAILRQTFPPKEQGMAMALFMTVVMLGPAIGPTLGGYIVDHWHWSWIFFINLPIGIVALMMVSRFVYEDPEIVAANRALAERQRSSIDWLGIGLLAVGLSTLQYFLEEGQRDDWFESRVIVVVFLVALGCLTTFIVRELTAETPAVDLSLFRDPVFASGTCIAALINALLMGSMFLLPVFMQELLGFTATQSGLALMPRVIAMLCATPIVGRLYNQLSPRIVIATGTLMVVVGSYLMSGLTLQSGADDFLAPNIIQGIGFACMFVPLTTTALSAVPRHRLADAAGLNSLVRQLGGAVGLSVFATLLSKYQVQAQASIAVHLDSGNPILIERLGMLEAGFVGRGMATQTAHSAAIATLHGISARQALVISFERVLLIAGLYLLLALPLLAILKVQRISSRTDPSPVEDGARVARPTEPAIAMD